MFHTASKRNETAVDWAVAIERNREALIRIVAALAAMAEYAGGTIAARLPQPLYRAVLRGLRPAESAVRRLIVIAARGLKVEPPPDRPKADRKAQERGQTDKPPRKSGSRVPAFRLFDTRKRFDLKPRRKPSAKGGSPRIWSVEPDPPPMPADLETGSGWGPVPFPLWQPVQLPKSEPAPAPVPDGTVSALRLGRRLAAVMAALENIPRQALRLKRWEARRERMKLLRPATIASPLRSGRPPGLRKRPTDEVERVLRECHDLAFEAAKHDTS
jgi:hypothetical protein